MARDRESILGVARLLIQVVRHAEELALLGWAAFQLTQDLVVPLAAHDYLAVDVLYVHVLAAVGIRAHQTRLVSDTCLDIIDRCRLGCLLQRRGRHVGVCCLLHAVDR